MGLQRIASPVIDRLKLHIQSFGNSLAIFWIGTMTSKSRRHAAAGAMAIAAAAFAMPASAATIFTDNFNRADSNTVGSGWIESGTNAPAVAISLNQLRLRGSQVATPDAAVRQSGFSTVGLTNIMVTVDWLALANNEIADTLNIAWAIGNPGTFNPASWTTAGSVGGLNASGFSVGQSFALGAAAAGQAAISIMLFSDVSAGGAGNNEGFVIDNFALTGDSIALIQLPGSMLLLLSGLGGIAVMGSKRKAG